MVKLLRRIGKIVAEHPLLAFGGAILGSLLLLTVISLLSGSPNNIEPQKVEEQLEKSTPVEEVSETNDYGDGSVLEDPREQQALNDYLEEAERLGVKEEDLHFDGSQEATVERRETISNRNGLYSLPYYGPEIYAEYIKVAPDGRFLIKVEYRGSIVAAQSTWDSFLRRKRDDGSQYLVLFEPAPR
jgi:hypothetical protein